MEVAQVQTLLQQQAQFLKDTIEQQTNAHAQAMTTMAQMVQALQADVKAAADQRSQPREKEGLTAKRAFTMLPYYNGKVDEYDTWRFQMIQFLSQDPILRQVPRVD